MENITLKKLAEILELSVPTVSRALNDSYEISEETKKRVRELAKALNYQPNPFAASLRKNKSKTIGLVVPEISNYFFTQITTGVEKICNEHGYHLIICSSNESPEKEASIIYNLTNGKVDGILLSTASEAHQTEHISRILQKKIPLVQFDRVVEDLPVSAVISNDFESAYDVTTKLLNDGHTKIAFLKYRNELTNIEKRLNGYLKALEDNDLTDKKLVVELTNNEENNITEIKRLIFEKKPEVIFCSVSLLAIGTYDVCKELGLTIPDDVKVIAYSNTPTARHLNPPLSTISKSAFEMGVKATELLFYQIKRKGECEIEKVLLGSKITYRKSSG
ncbi:LacI family DNA-binding transcriptional regulator [Pseudopedobacter sp.]|uniref:LacI family DNA-binding transcriptional regulator n=1 Tax=Pseudopedobacter sp. TaxID=1936787 RepID=UPI0033429C29